jgi:hypothetical protein
MIPAVPLPAKSRIRIPVEVKLKPGWRFDSRGRAFESASGERFVPRELPQKTRIVHKTPALARADASKLSGPERELTRYLQIILPEGESPERYVEAIRSWAPVEEAHVAPLPSLPDAD